DLGFHSARCVVRAEVGAAPSAPAQSLESATLPLLLPKLLSIEQVHGDCGGRVRPPANGAAQRGSVVDPIKNLSTACAAWRPSRIAPTTSDWPRRMSPAADTFGLELC